MNLVFKNREIKALAELLGSLTLKGQQSRWRTRLLDVLAIHYNANVNQSLIKLADDFAIRDENDEYIYVDDNKQSIKVSLDYYKEEEILLNEELVIECNETNKKMILMNSKILLDGDFNVQPEVAKLYDLWCERFESAVEYYEEKVFE